MCDGITFEIFKMPLSEEDFYKEYPFLEQYRETVESGYKASSRRKEILSEKIMLRKLFPNEDVKLTHNEDGRPFLSNGMNVSISHTKNYLAIIVSRDKNVALDVEHVSDRVKRVGRMYLRKDENYTEINEMLVVWCVKETMYKLFSSQNLTFEEIHVHPFSAEDHGTVYADNLKSGDTVTLTYSVNDEYVITKAYK